VRREGEKEGEADSIGRLAREPSRKSAEKRKRKGNLLHRLETGGTEK
jgi:hypothetical protein